MKQSKGVGAIALMVVLLSLSSSSLASGLEEHLRFLEPLVGKEWTGGYVGSESPDIEILLRFEQVLGGRAVRYVREVEAAGFSGLTHFYWNPGREEICFISLYNRDIVAEGVVSVEDGGIVLRGQSHRPDTTIEFKTILNIDSKGVLRDTFLRMENGEWVQGHIQEFVAGD
jgi:hypothetical protein